MKVLGKGQLPEQPVIVKANVAVTSLTKRARCGCPSAPGTLLHQRGRGEDQSCRLPLLKIQPVQDLWL